MSWRETLGVAEAAGKSHAHNPHNTQKAAGRAILRIVRILRRREMDQGKRPAHYTKRATCRHCGPIWLWFSGEVLGLPLVLEPRGREAIAGLWDADRRYCDRYLPRSQPSDNDGSADDEYLTKG